MKSTIYCIMILGFLSCNGRTTNTDTLAKETSVFAGEDSTQNSAVSTSTNQPETTYNEVDLLPNDSLFDQLEPELMEIKEKEFNQLKNGYKIKCVIDSSGFVRGYGLTVTTSCHEICVTHLVDSTRKKMIQLPSGYDQGIAGLVFSPSCNQFIIYSGYDLPDYDNYYQYRAEIIGFNITTGKGLEAIKPSFKYFTKDWSIADVTWVDEKTIALKVYEGEIPSKDNNFYHRYFKARLYK